MSDQKDQLFRDLHTKKEEQLFKAVRVGSDYHADKLRRSNRELFDQNAIQKDISDINEVLSDKELGLMSEERSRLEMIKGRNLSSLLILDEKTTGDSSDMKAVKKSVAAIEGELDQKRKSPFTEKNIDDVLKLYDIAILACKDYMKDKKPSYSNGIGRYEKVTMNMVRLHEEAEAFLAAKELIRTGVLDGKVANGRELLVQAKVYGIGEPAGYPEGEAEKRKAPTEVELKKAGREAGVLYRAFSGKETPSDLIARLSKSKSKTERMYARQLPALFANIRNSLSDFKEGKIAAKVFLFGNDVLSVSQNAFGQLTLRAGGVNIPLERNTGVMADILARDIVKNEKVYGSKAADRVIKDVIRGVDVSKENTEKRQIITDYLTKHTKYPATAFSNFYTNDLAYMIRNIFRGKNIVIVKEESINKNAQFSDNDLVYAEEGKSLINVAESKELLQRTLAEENREKVTSQVTMKQKEKEPEEGQPEKKEQKEEKEEEKKEGEWSKKEESIKNLLGDMLFSYETWIADEQLKKPGARMKLMLEKNSEAVAYLISDMFLKGTLNYKLVNGMLDQMPLFMMKSDETEKLRKSITDSLNKAAEVIKGKVDALILKKLGDRPEGFWEGVKYDGKKLLVDGAAYMHLITPKSLLKGIEIKGADGEAIIQVDGLKDIIGSIDLKTVEKLGEAEKVIDVGVEVASAMIQETVNTYSGELFKGAEKTEEKKLPDPYERGIDEATKKERMRERVRLGNERLNRMTKDSVQNGDSGLGLFTKNVFEQYFKGVDTMDKRSMLGSMVRNAKPVGKLLDEDDKSLDLNAPELSTEEFVKLLGEGNLAPEAQSELTEEITRRAKEKERRKEEKERRRVHNEKIKTEAMANYIGGMLKGAGPLFQKMMQGLPTEGLPEELKGAVQDMKSKLAPIPSEIVEAELQNIVDSSHNQIKNISVVKPLGAASVGQTFLCKITRSDGTEEETAIKLLKPDVRNRMMREKQLMINCARLTDIKQREKDNVERANKGQSPLPALKKDEKGGMQVTYEGQLERIEEELDLTIEARNVELGKIYDKEKKKGDEKVVSMKLNTLVQPTTNSMVLEKAPGETIDSLLERIKTETQEIKDVYKKSNYIDPSLPKEAKEQLKQRFESFPYYGGALSMRLERGIEKYSEEWDKFQPHMLQEKLAMRLAELKRKKAYLDAFARKWTVEGMFGEGFYHGDPHEGNIMVDDEKLTVIDFGNCTKLSDDQKLQVTRMLAAASIGDMDTFRHGFHMLLKPEFEELYQQKRTELGNKIKEIFELGDKRATGSRIAVALLEAQKLGLEVPSAVYNFSQGQMRLQNAIDHFNQQIKATEEEAVYYSDVSAEDHLFDFTNTTKEHDARVNSDLDVAADAYKKDLIVFSNSPEDLKQFAFEQSITIKKAYLDKFKEQSGKLDKAVKDFKQMASTVDEMKTVPDFAPITITKMVEGIFRNVNSVIDSSLVEEANACLLEEKTDEAKVEAIVQRLKQAKAEANESLNAYDVMEQKRLAILSKHGNKWKPTEREQAEYDALRDRFVQAVSPVHERYLKSVPEFKDTFSNLTMTELREETGKAVASFFRTFPEGKEEFMKKYQDFLQAQDDKLIEKDPAAYFEKRNALEHEYMLVMQRRLQEKHKVYREACKECNKDFLDIMSDIIDENMFTLGRRLGVMKSISFNSKLNAMNKKEKYMNS